MILPKCRSSASSPKREASGILNMEMNQLKRKVCTQDS